ncbi:MAG: ABC transporter permease [Planctomycetes bacterium]|nr:ABC transporter permease [Planctomycetota bacterium]
MSDAPRAEATVALAAEPAGPWRLAWRRLRRNRAALFALGVLTILTVIALGAPLWAPYDYARQFQGAERVPPGWSGEVRDAANGDMRASRHWLGTDDNGRDTLSRIVYGARVSLLVGILATLVSLVLGVAVGLVAGFHGGWLDAALMRVTDTVYAFPSVLLAVAITAVFDRPSLWVVFLALGLVGWTGIARLVRSQVLTVKTLDYITAARAMGAGSARILVRHVLPNCLGPIVVAGTLALGGNILGEAGLSFLGLGVQEPYPSWGGMLANARQNYQYYWWLAVFPGAAIVITVLAFNLFGDGLRDALDPRARR